MRIQISLDGDQLVKAHYEGIAWRVLNLHGGWQAVFRMLEAEETDFFEAIAPRLYKTGRLRRSLTRPGGEAIREAHRGTVRFGTRVPYAKFQRPRPLRINSVIANMAAGEMARYIMGGRREGIL